MRKALLIGSGAAVVGFLFITHGTYIMAYHHACRNRGECPDHWNFIWNGLILGKPVDWSGTQYE